MDDNMLGKIVVLNGAPRSGKSSIVSVIQQTFEDVWMNLGVDKFIHMTPCGYFPGIGLRPGGEQPDLEPVVCAMYHAMYESIAAHSRAGLNVVVDVGHHDRFSIPRGILFDCARLLDGFPALFAGIRCPLDEIMRRRQITGYNAYDEDGSIPVPVLLWQESVHSPGIYDIEVDTSIYSAEECAARINDRLSDSAPLTAFRKLSLSNVLKP